MPIGARSVTPELETHERQVPYVIDLGTSDFTLQVFSGGLMSPFGHSPKIAIRDFSGEAQVDPEDVAHSSLKVTIKAQSLTVRDDVSDKDRREIERIMQQEVLESAAYPEVAYECESVVAAKTGEAQYAVTLNGELTMHGITRSQTVIARVTIMEGSLRAFGNFSVLQSDYELKKVVIAGGALKLKDELKFSFNILARKKA